MYVNLYEGLLKYMYIIGKYDGNSKFIINSRYDEVI